MIEFHRTTSRRDSEMRIKHWYAPGLGVVLKRRVEVIAGTERLGQDWDATRVFLTR